jgi:glycosyltransferase involved in cell wall biosynthesis
MKVLHLLNELRPSGAEVMLRSAGPLWKEHDIECGVLGTAATVGPFAGQLAQAGYTIHHLPRTKTPAHFWAVARLIRQHGYSVVHQHLEGAGYWYSTAALAAGASVVRTIHNNFPFGGWLRRVRGFQRRHLARRGVLFASIAPGVQANEQARFGLATRLVINWIDDRFMSSVSAAERQQARRRFGFAEDQFVLVSVGNCSHVKNHTLVLDAIARCSDLAQLRYLHVGVEETGEPERSYAAGVGVDGKVLFVGWSTDALPALLAADAYVMPSLFEGLTLAALEALATGLPALLAASPGLKDLKAFFPNLLYFDLAPEDAARAIRVLAEEEPAVRFERAREYPGICKLNFSARRGVTDYVNLYRESRRA